MSNSPILTRCPVKSCENEGFSVSSQPEPVRRVFFNDPFRRLIFLCLLISVIRTGAAADVARESQLAGDLLKTAAVKQAVWLASKNGKFLGLYLETEKSPSSKAAIILHDQDGGPDQPLFVRRLRQALPDRGWSTLSLQLPLREQGADRQDYFSLLPETSERIQAGIRYLTDHQAGNIVLVGYGLGALAALYSAQNQPTSIAGIVAVSLGVPAAAPKMAQTLELIKNLKLPLVDIYAEHDQPDIVATASDRRLAARGRSDYRQIEIGLVDHTYQNDLDLAIKRVYGGLEKMAEKFPEPLNRKN